MFVDCQKKRVRTGNVPAKPNCPRVKFLIFLAIPAGFEPATPCLEGRCSIQLSYGIVLISFIIFPFLRRPHSEKVSKRYDVNLPARTISLEALAIDSTPRRPPEQAAEARHDDGPMPLSR
jgi:hypothetical protein